jgi:hypothetical protein
MHDLDAFPLGELPPEYARLFALLLSLVGIAPNVELYKGDVRVTPDFDESRFSAAHGGHPDWTGLRDW